MKLKLTKPHKYKISFCSTCMGRLHHLEKTILTNIHDNIAYGNVEFVLLNYGSQDKIDEWVSKELAGYIESGLVIYVKTTEPVHWDASHAKNIVSRYSSGEIICNVDSDHFTGKGFARYTNDYFNENKSIFLTGRTQGADYDAVGRVCMWRSDFMKIRGYDEAILGYGFEDYDLYARLENIGLKEEYIDHKFLKSISHENSERFKNTRLFYDVEFVILHKTKNHFSAFVFKKNKKFDHITSALTYDDKVLKMSIDDQKTQTGEWKIIIGKIILKTQNSILFIERIEGSDGEFMFDNQKYYISGDQDKIDPFCYYALLHNQSVYLKNKNAKSIINPNGFGNSNALQKKCKLLK